jgi:hypothetical protein
LLHVLQADALVGRGGALKKHAVTTERRGAC